MGINATDTRSKEGIPKVYPTTKPVDTTTIFIGEDDNGNKLLFNLLDTDSYKQVDLTFNKEVHIKDGFMIVENAPFGASLDVEVVNPIDDSTISVYCFKAPLFGSGWFTLDSDDRADLPAGIILRVRVNNSSGMGDEDPPANFKMAGRVEMFK